jgi:hypothetical protein
MAHVEGSGTAVAALGTPPLGFQIGSTTIGAPPSTPPGNPIGSAAATSGSITGVVAGMTTGGGGDGTFQR